ncbi:MAG: hypothetical protein AAGD13_18735 [Pseudomonadota bacterium]
MPDIFEDRSSGLESPGYDAISVTPSDSNDLTFTSRALYVGVAGDLRVTTAGGSTVTFTNVAEGVLPMRVSRVLASGTTAADIVAIW